ncbi:putative manganese-dependent inorganic diphosphatase [Hathewaya histolytica]|uniref:inorganic diphosphatase n=1 Tax=Hathewaya histolytica TaxID=1498 RepID=A0A4U9RAJ7_HATHI|nr:putative manganese-dependent inorganic diphosphatase [Hathewaya histolytica]VTQ87821.1 manganese-dependent inorganic pyrophosphatase [Hathewaya histolytica]
MKDFVYISGHKNPDSDSICAAIGYAEFKNKTGDIEAIPVRLGNVSRETQFILDYFNVEKPKFIDTVKPQISDLDIDKVPTISSYVSLKEAWDIMQKEGSMTLPVVDENSKLMGVVSSSNLASTYMKLWDNSILAKSNTSIESILHTLNGKTLYINENTSIKGKILIGAMSPNSIKNFIEEGDVVICGDREDAQEIIAMSKASLMIVTGEHNVSDNIISKCKENGCSIIMTPYDSLTASRIITQSIPVDYVMAKENIISFNENDFIEDVKKQMQETRFKSYPVLDEDGKVLGLISRYHLLSKNKKKVILVDHNELSQSVDGLEDAELLEILDHHRLGGIQTGLPVYFRNEIIGSTSSIVALRFFENGITPSREVAGLLSGALISDTLLLKSPTTTERDKDILNKLCAIAGIKAEDFAKEMFKAGTSLDGKTPEEIFHQDFKTFSLNSFKVGVSQITTMDLDGFRVKKGELISLMEDKAKSQRYDLLLLLATDILEASSEVVPVGKYKDLVGTAFNVKFTGDSAYVPGVVSRKKQVIPPLTEVFNNLK